MDDRERLKEHLQDFAAANLEKSKSGLYCCPACGSGTGPNRSGALGIYDSGMKWKCQACGKGGDLFDLIGVIYHTTDAAEQFRMAREIYGGAIQSAPAREYVPQTTRARENVRKSQHTAQHTHEAHADFSHYIESSRAALKNSLEAVAYLQGRGISETTAARARLGYDERTRSIVIPYDRNGGYYTTRTIEGKAYRKPKTEEAGPQPLYNRADLHNAANAPIFVLEGEIDAISVIEAGGHAVALCGAKNGRKLLQEIEQNPASGPLILSLDNDEAGLTASAEIGAELAQMGVNFITANIAGAYKDANEALTENRQAFTQAVQAAIYAATQQAEKTEEEKRAEEREQYKRKSARAYIEGFINGIADSVNTSYIPTGFPKLDEVLDGGLYEGLYILGAISSLGKTTFTLQAADQIAAAGTDVIIFSLEMARSELMAKSISRETCLFSLEKCGKTSLAKTTRGITTGKRYANYSPEEVEAIKQAAARYGEYAGNLYIFEGMGDIGPQVIRETAAEHIRITGRTPVIIIDYLQLLAPHDPRATDKQNMDRAVMELKRISRDHKLPVIAISSLNRQSYSAPISMEAFKESGAIEYSSDVLIGLQAKGAGSNGFDVDEAKRKDPREIEMKILKNRNGRTGDVLEFAYYPLFNLYREVGKVEATPTQQRQRR